MSDRPNTSMDVPLTPAEQAVAAAAPATSDHDPNTTTAAQQEPTPGPDDTSTTEATVGEVTPLPGADATTSVEPVHAPAAGDTAVLTEVDVTAPDAAGSAEPGGTATVVETELECPQCGLVLVGDSPRPTAEWFCPRCDFPVFWASPPPPEAPAHPRARRRLPGADGTEVLGAEPCWKCGELNGPDNGACVRCNAQLPQPIEHIREVEVVVPTPMPVPYVLTTVTWPFVLAAFLAGLAVGVMVILGVQWRQGTLLTPESITALGALPLLHRSRRPR